RRGVPCGHGRRGSGETRRTRREGAASRGTQHRRRRRRPAQHGPGRRSGRGGNRRGVGPSPGGAAGAAGRGEAVVGRPFGTALFSAHARGRGTGAKPFGREGAAMSDEKDYTALFRVDSESEAVTRAGRILQEVHRALSERGYDPVNQLVGYLLSG